VSTRVLLVVAGSTVSQAAIFRTAELAQGAPVTVIGLGEGYPSRTEDGPAEEPHGGQPGRTGPPGVNTEQLRRAVALAMSVLENAGVAALGHVAVTDSPARAVARIARARGARVVVLDQRGLPNADRGAGPGVGGSRSGGGGRLAAELRRRMYGSGIVVVSAGDDGAKP
jgi:hypothetical protein